jgi:hypothetical protein
VTEALNRDGRLLLGLWMQPRPAVILVSRVNKFLEKVPIANRDQVRNWKDWEILLKPVARCDQVTLASTQKPASFRLRLHGCR